MSTPALPPGFDIDAAPALPPGFEIDNSSSARPADKVGNAALGLPTYSLLNGDKKPEVPAKSAPVKGRVEQVLDTALAPFGLTAAGLETGLHVGSGMTTGAFGMLSGLVKSALSNTAVAAGSKDPGVQEMAKKPLDQSMAEGASQFTYEPRTEGAKENVEKYVGPLMNEALPLAGIHGVGAPGGVKTGLRAATDAVGAGTDSALTALTPKIAPEKAALAAKAQDAGIQLQPHQLVDNKLVRTAGEALNDVPMSGGKSKVNRAAFTQGLVKAVDPESTATKLTPDVYAQVMDKAGSKIGEIADRTPVPVETFKFEDLTKKQTPDVAKVLNDYMEDIQNKAAENNGAVDGTVLRKIRTEISSQSRSTSNGDLRNALGNLTKRIDDAISEHAPEADLTALAEARRQYAIGKTLEPLVAKSADGEISPQSLMARVTGDRAGKARMARGKGGELGDYARIGQQFLKEQASSGTAERGLVYQMMTGAVDASKTAAKYPFALAYNMLGPRIANRIIEKSKPAQEASPSKPVEPTLERGFESKPAQEASPNPLGDLTPDWQTEPGANVGPKPEAIDATGLTPALGDQAPTTGSPKGNKALDIPAAEGLPGLDDVAVAGPRFVDAAPGSQARLAERPREPIPEIGSNRTKSAQESAHPRVAELERLKSQTTSDVARKALDDELSSVKKELAEETRKKSQLDAAVELRKVANEAQDPALQAKLRERANKMEAAEKVPTGEVVEGAPKLEDKAPKKIPSGEVKEGLPETANEPANPKQLPVGEAKEVTASGVELEPKVPVGEARHLNSLDLPKLDDAFFDQQVQKDEVLKQPAPTARGIANVRKQLEEGAKNGTVNADGAALALWALDKNPNLANDLALSLGKEAPAKGRQGTYSPSERIITLFKGADNAETAAHEILHHSERMMPPEVQRGIRREMRKVYDALPPDKKKAVDDFRKVTNAGDAEAKVRLKQAVKDGVIGEGDYHLLDPSEFWAVNASRILNDRFAARGSWRAEAKQWMKEMVEHVKGLVGVRSDSPVLKALDQVLNSEKTGGEFAEGAQLIERRKTPRPKTGNSP